MTGPWEALAERVARSAHGTDRNKHDGEPYILHPERVVAYLVGATDIQRAIGWLHDVVEDTSETLESLARYGFPPAVLAGVDAITKRKGESNLDYLHRLAKNRDALKVKLLADLKDNTDPKRRTNVPEATGARLDRKYVVAYRVLTEYYLKEI